MLLWNSWEYFTYLTDEGLKEVRKFKENIRNWEKEKEKRFDGG